MEIVPSNPSCGEETLESRIALKEGLEMRYRTPTPSGMGIEASGDPLCAVVLINLQLLRPCPSS